MKNLYYSEQTEKAKKNFNLDYAKTDLDLIHTIVEIKIAAAKANYLAKRIDMPIKDAIIQASKEILNGNYDDQFVICAIQGGAGTSINMNVNEVIANRATEILGKRIHPNDHVNCSQSTNDVNPTALRILSYRLIKQLIKNLESLYASFDVKAYEMKDISKIARTHLQDAVPTTLGDEFLAYSNIIKKHIELLKISKKILLKINLGGTAIGNGINANKVYRESVVEILSEQIKIKLNRAENLMAATSSGTDLVFIHDLITNVFIDLSKIATDLRFLSSGPKAGIAEIRLEPLQAGSSIMPGKINPVIPELVNQVYYFILGKNVTIKYATEQANLELCLMFPVMADSLISSLKLANSTIPKFCNCIRTLRANEQVCNINLEKSNAYATYLIEKLGYDLTSRLVNEANQKNKSLRETVITNKALSNEEFDQTVS